MSEVDRETIASLLQTIDRYNPGNLGIFVQYVRDTVRVPTFQTDAAPERCCHSPHAGL